MGIDKATFSPATAIFSMLIGRSSLGTVQQCTQISSLITLYTLSKSTIYSSIQQNGHWGVRHDPGRKLSRYWAISNESHLPHLLRLQVSWGLLDATALLQGYHTLYLLSRGKPYVAKWIWLGGIYQLVRLLAQGTTARPITETFEVALAESMFAIPSGIPTLIPSCVLPSNEPSIVHNIIPTNETSNKFTTSPPFALIFDISYMIPTFSSSFLQCSEFPSLLLPLLSHMWNPLMNLQ